VKERGWSLFFTCLAVVLLLGTAVANAYATIVQEAWFDLILGVILPLGSLYEWRKQRLRSEEAREVADRLFGLLLITLMLYSEHLWL